MLEDGPVKNYVPKQLKKRVGHIDFPHRAGNDPNRVRFEFLEEYLPSKQKYVVTRVSALRGHSTPGIDESAGQEKQDLDIVPETIIHGTRQRHLSPILQQGFIAGGVSKGTRNEHNFATVAAWDHEAAGYRCGGEVSISFNGIKMMGWR